MPAKVWYIANANPPIKARVAPYFKEFMTYIQPLSDEGKIALRERPRSIVPAQGGWQAATNKLLESCDLIVVPLDQTYFASPAEDYMAERAAIRRSAGKIPIVVIKLGGADLQDLGFNPDHVFPENGAINELDQKAQNQAWITLKKMLVRTYLDRPIMSTHEQTRIVYLKSLTLTGFKCFDKLKIDFSRKSLLGGRWHCIAGVNGKGKTSILEAVCIGLLGPHVAELGQNLVARKQRSGETTSINLSLEEPGLTLSMGLEKGVFLDTNRDRYAQHEGWEKFWTGFFISLGATRDFSENRKPDKRISENLRRHLTLFDPLEPAIDDIDYFTGDHGLAATVLMELLEKILVDLKITLAPDRTRLNFMVDGKPCPLLELPSGYRSLVILLAAIAREWARTTQNKGQSSKLSDIQGLVLLDEIDLHLHPTLQRVVVPRLRQHLPAVQWIVTTHSPLVLSNFDTNELTWLEGKGATKHLDQQILAYSPDQIYEFLMGTEPMSAYKQYFLNYEQQKLDDPNTLRPVELTPALLNQFTMPGQTPGLTQTQMKKRHERWREIVKKYRGTGTV